jgi:uncharacterized membrane protein YphA (DoxX/SURF4 family)
MKRAQLKTIAYWATTILGPASFVIGGTLSLTHSSQVSESLQHLGYPAYFAMLLGVGKLAGAIVTVLPGMPRLKEWAYAGFCIELTSAAFSHVAVGDSAIDIIAPLLFLALVLASWALRPASRKLGGDRRSATRSLDDSVWLPAPPRQPVRAS